MHPRARRSHWAYAVTGRSGSLHPTGQPIIQSVKCGFKVRASVAVFSPFSKVTRPGSEKGKLSPIQPAAVRIDVNNVHATTAFRKPI